MGKNSAIEELGSIIGNTVVHKIIGEKTNRLESKGFLGAEEIEYRAQARKKGKLYNWNALDIQQIKEKAVKKIKNKFSIRYADVSFSEKEAEKLVDEELKTLLEK